MLNDSSLAGLKAGNRQQLADVARWQITLPICDQGFREVLVNPPLVLARMWIEANGHEAATCSQHSPRVTEERDRIVEMVKGIHAIKAAAPAAHAGQRFRATADEMLWAYRRSRHLQHSGGGIQADDVDVRFPEPAQPMSRTAAHLENQLPSVRSGNECRQRLLDARVVIPQIPALVDVGNAVVVDSLTHFTSTPP